MNRLLWISLTLAALGCGAPVGDPVENCVADVAALCAAAGKNCGSVTVQACGESTAVECGGCEAPDSCGGGGQTNVCGRSPCAFGCPDGFQCDAEGVCAGGALSGLSLDVPTVSVSGEIRLDGQVPVKGAFCDADQKIMARVRFQDLETSAYVDIPVRCVQGDFSFGGRVRPSVYRVAVVGLGAGWSNLPNGTVYVKDRLVVAEDITGLSLEPMTVLLEGSLLVNGAPPTTGASCTGQGAATKAHLSFFDKMTANRVLLPVRCDAAGHAFSGRLPKGEYALTVTGSQGMSSLPILPTHAASGVAVAADTAGFVADIPMTSVSGQVRIGGSPPPDGALCSISPSSTKATVHFTGVDTSTVATAKIPCTSTQYDFTVELPEGTYKVSVQGHGTQYVELPEGRAGVNNALVVGPSSSALTLDLTAAQVSGKVTLAGAAPTTGPDCTDKGSSPKAYVYLSAPAQNSLLTLPIRCDSADFSFSGLVPPGTYEVYVLAIGAGWAGLGDGYHSVVRALTISGDVNDLALDLTLRDVSGQLTLDGALPTLGTHCASSPTANEGTVLFTALEGSAYARGYIRCDDAGFTFDAKLAPGDYVVTHTSVQDGSNLPPGHLPLVERLRVP